jgi:glutamate synthase domain-containing protein 1
MKDLASISNPYKESKVIDACSIFGIMDTSGRRFDGSRITTAIGNMHLRGNGLGGGLAAYGIYPDYAGYYALHIMFMSFSARQVVEGYLKEHFDIALGEEIPVRPLQEILKQPQVWRYFVTPSRCLADGVAEEDYVAERVMAINTTLDGSYVFSSGKDMGVFKGVGYPETISRYFRLEEYQGYLWTAHGRFPTNSHAWWGGAHPFSMLDWTVVHNGEISSYGINRRYLEQFGYSCTMETDTEVIAYAIDLLVRRHGLPVEVAARVLAPPFWDDIQRYQPEQKELYSALRQVYGSLLLNGPFTVIVAHQGEMIGLADRVRLRPLVVGVKGSELFLSSEEASIRLICPDLDASWMPCGGEPVIARLGEKPVICQRATCPQGVACNA